MEKIESIKNILQRERAARKAAEQVIEQKSLELYLANQKLRSLNAELEDKVKERTYELLKQKEKAEEATRAKSRFLSSMSHEIRTPLNAIIGLTEILHRDRRDEDTQSLKMAADSLLHILNDILDFSKIEAGKLSFESISFSLSEITQTLDKTYRLQAEQKRLDFRIEKEEGIPDRLIGDPTKLIQILSNLISNAIKFTHVGRVRVNIQAEKRQKDKILLVVSIKDTGIGMSEEEQSIIFESFRQAHAGMNRKYGGSGLGLSITQKLIELQGGNLKVRSNLGQGSTFTFDIPYEIELSDQEDPFVQEEKDYSPLSQLELLLVEDVKMNQFMMKKLFERQQIKSSIAENGIEALEILEKKDFDLVLMDLHMPEMDGKRATILIRDTSTPVRNHNIPIIGLTADISPQIKEEMLALGMNDFLTKPIDIDQLYDKLLSFSSHPGI